MAKLLLAQAWQTKPHRCDDPFRVYYTVEPLVAVSVSISRSKPQVCQLGNTLRLIAGKAAEIFLTQVERYVDFILFLYF